MADFPPAEQLETSGTDQAQRPASMLDPSKVLIDERSLEEVIQFLQRLANKTDYHGRDPSTPSGTWSGFLGQEPKYVQAMLLRVLGQPIHDPSDPNLGPWAEVPHRTLLAVFLRLFQQGQAVLNQLPARHLDLFYKQALHLTTRAARADQVHLIFKAKTDAQTFRIAKGTQFSAGQDTSGKPQIYALEDEVFVGPAEIAELRTVRPLVTIIDLPGVLARYGEIELTLWQMLQLTYTQQKVGPKDQDQDQDQDQDKDKYMPWLSEGHLDPSSRVPEDFPDSWWLELGRRAFWSNHPGGVRDSRAEALRSIALSIGELESMLEAIDRRAANDLNDWAAVRAGLIAYTHGAPTQSQDYWKMLAEALGLDPPLTLLTHTQLIDAHNALMDEERYPGPVYRNMRRALRDIDEDRLLIRRLLIRAIPIDFGALTTPDKAGPPLSPASQKINDDITVFGNEPALDGDSLRDASWDLDGAVEALLAGRLDWRGNTFAGERKGTVAVLRSYVDEIRALEGLYALRRDELQSLLLAIHFPSFPVVLRLRGTDWGTVEDLLTQGFTRLTYLQRRAEIRQARQPPIPPPDPPLASNLLGYQRGLRRALTPLNSDLVQPYISQHFEQLSKLRDQIAAHETALTPDQWSTVDELLAKAWANKTTSTRDDPMSLGQRVAQIIAAREPPPGLCREGNDWSGYQRSLEFALSPLATPLLEPYFKSKPDYDELLELETKQRDYEAGEVGSKALSPSEWRRVDQLLAIAWLAKTGPEPGETLDGLAHKIALAREGTGNDWSGYQRGLKFVLDVASDSGPLTARQLLAYLSPSDFDELRLLEYEIRNNPESMSERQWQRVDELLSIARSAKEQLPMPKPQLSIWQGLAVFPDATKAVVPTTPQAWETFGGSEVSPGTSAGIGFAVSSPLLQLSEGHRSIFLRLHFDESVHTYDTLREWFANPQAELPFQVTLSTAKGWMKVEHVQVMYTTSEADSDAWFDDPRTTLPLAVLASAAKGRVPLAGLSVGRAAGPGKGPAILKLRLDLGPESPAVTSLAGSPSGTPEPSQPTLRFELLNRPADDSRPADALFGLRVGRVDLKVRCGGQDATDEGLRQLSAWTGNGKVDPTKPFEPFTHDPLPQSTLAFTHEDLVAKPLSWIRVDLPWMGAPQDFVSHYAGYPSDVPNFVVQAALFDHGKLTSLGKYNLLIHQGTDDAVEVVADDKLVVAGDNGEGLPKTGRFDSAAARPDDPDNRHFQITFEGNLGVDVYPATATLRANQLAVALSTSTPSPNTQPIQQPYTPKLTSLSVSYASVTSLPTALETKEPMMQFVHIHPFGLTTKDISANPSLLPDYRQTGRLYLGVSALEAPATLSILFQVLEGSAVGGEQALSSSWSVLDGPDWKPLGSGLLSDGTNGFLNSGIVDLNLPAVGASTVMPPDRYWIQITQSTDDGKVCDMLAIRAQAGTARFVDQDNSPDHFAQPLAQGSISKPVAPIVGLDTVEQPYSSFGGRPAEQTQHFRVRVSERLRHRSRAVVAWDFERLVLEAFPWVYSIKCLPAVDDPGRLRVIVIPDQRERVPRSPFAPRASDIQLLRIRELLARQASPFARIEVQNPVYVQLQVRVALRLAPGVDPQWAQHKLSQSIKQYITPWAFEPSTDIMFGQSVYSGAIIDYVETQDYVDHVMQMRILTVGQASEGSKPETTEFGNSARASSEEQVLVSAPEHIIEIVESSRYETEVLSGVGYWIINEDFEVGVGGADSALFDGLGNWIVGFDFTVGSLDDQQVFDGIGYWTIGRNFVVSASTKESSS